ncbi:MAG: hypothetical protein AAFQ50_09025 [Pseudomonadota bacterium]
MSAPATATPGQQAIWDTLRDSGCPLTTAQIVEVTDMSRASVQWVLRSWREADYITASGAGNQVTYEMRLEYLELTQAPVPDRKMWRTPNEDAAQHLWNGARQLKVGWSGGELRAHSPIADQITDDQVRNFINLLMRSGYLKVLSKARSRSGRSTPARYRLIRDTGPLPPQEKRMRVTYDPNLADITHVPEVQE